MKKWLTFVLSSAVLILLAACGDATSTGEQENESNDQLNVVATNSIIADMAEQVGGGLINIHSLVPIGTDPHEHEVLPEDIQKSEESD
ncbi:Zinc-uptake complex component A, substrate-binding, partial [Alkalibacterium gilvum]